MSEVRDTTYDKDLVCNWSFSRTAEIVNADLNAGDNVVVPTVRDPRKISPASAHRSPSCRRLRCERGSGKRCSGSSAIKKFGRIDVPVNNGGYG